MRSTLVRCLLLVCALVALPVSGFAQEAVLSGTVTDTTGGVLPGVTVTAVHQATGNRFDGVTDERGMFRIPARIGTFNLTAELQGFNTVTQKFLRGFQMSDTNGQVRFTTVYPGWYPGRATHIHFKIRKANEEFTSQFFFDDTLSNEVNNTLAPYSQKGANGRTQNATDGIYRQSNGMLLLDVQKNGNAYAATFDIGIRA